MTTMMIILAVLLAGFGLTWTAGTAYKWFVRGENVRVTSPWICGTSLVLAVALAIASVIVRPQDANLALLNADNLGFNISSDEEIPMRGFKTNSEIDEFLQEIYGNRYEEIWSGMTEQEFFFENDQNKIAANRDYLRAMGYKDNTGFRNGVLFPSEALKAEDYKNLSTWTTEELERLFEQHRYYDVYAHVLTNVRYCDMWLQDMEEIPEFVQQNDTWAPRLREQIDEYKRTGESATLYVTEADGTVHYSDSYRYDAARLCVTLENAIIRGVGTPTSTMNWELPSMNPEVETRWTVKLTEPADQEDYPAFIWSFPNVKSGRFAYGQAVNAADLRVEQCDPEEEPNKTPPAKETPTETPKPTTTPTPTPTPTPKPVTHEVYTYYRLLNTETDIAEMTHQTVAEGADYNTTAKAIDGYVYDGNSHNTKSATVTGKMGNGDVTVVFYYTAERRVTYHTVTAKHVDEVTGTTMDSVSIQVVDGGSTTVSKRSFSGYVYSRNDYTGDKTVSVEVKNVTSDITVTFFYYKEYTLTVRFLEEGTNKVLHAPQQAYYRGNQNYTATAVDITGYELVRNSVNGKSTAKTVTGAMNNQNQTVTFYYRATQVQPQTFTVTTVHKVISTQKVLDKTTKTVTVGAQYTTAQGTFDGYAFRYTTGDKTSGEMPNRNVEVVYWYEKETAPSYKVNVSYKVDGTNEVLDTMSWTQQVGTHYTTSRKSFDGYTFSRLSGDNTSGDMPSRDVNVTYWYTKQAEEPQMFTVTTQYRVVGTNETLKTETKEVQAGKSYSTEKRTFTGYTFSYTSGDATSGTMPFRNVTVAYWYDKEVVTQKYTVTVTHKSVDSGNLLDQSSWQQEVGTHYTSSKQTFTGYHFVGTEGDATSGTMPSRSVSVTYLYALDKAEPNGTKDPDSGPGNNGTGNATEGIGPGNGEEDNYIPPVIHDTEDKTGDEETSNHKPTDNPGGQGAGSEERQEPSTETESGIVGDDEETNSSGTGGKDPGHVDTGTDEGVQEVEGGGYTPPEKGEITPDLPPSDSDPVLGDDETMDWVP